MPFTTSVYEACRVSRRIFVMHPEYKRTNFYAQQLRSLALIREIVAQGDLSIDEPQLIVVGGGIAGLTAAAAALTAGFGVTLIERNGYLDQFKEASHRELHPNLISWPFQAPRALTDLPFLNWACGPADIVVRDLVNQWQQDFAKHVSAITDTVVGLKEGSNGVEAICQNGRSRSGSVVLLAIGWERERINGKTIGPSYWLPQSFEDCEVVVSGSGDGGLIDTAYQTYGPKTVSVSRMLAYLLEQKPHKQWIKAAEEKAIKAINEAASQEQRDEAYDRLSAFYEQLTIEDEDATMLAEYRRPKPLKARLIYEKRSAFSPFVAPINKTLFSTLIKPPAEMVRLEQGKIDLHGDKLIKESVGLTTEELDDRTAVIRHGAEAAVLKGNLLTDDQKAILQGVPIENLAQIVPDEYDLDFYAKSPLRKISPSLYYNREVFCDRVAKQIENMVRHICDKGEDFTLRREVGLSWKVTSKSNEFRRDLKTVFPIRTEEFNVELIESPPIFDVVQ
jgi:hypothetical protein